MVQAFGCVGD